MLKKYITVYLVAVLVLGSFVAGLIVGRSYLPVESTVKMDQVGQFFGIESDDPLPVSFQQFWDVLGLVEDKHVDGDIDYQEYLHGAIRGALRSLDDPYTIFQDPDETARFQEDIDGIFEGIGAEIGIRNDLLTVIAPLDGSPAQQVGLAAGDIILRIDGQPTLDMTVLEAVELIRGPKDTEIILTISSSGDDPRDVSITRDTIDVPSVTLENLDGGLAVLSISRFGEDTFSEVQRYARDILRVGNTGVILDLRNNPGGFLDSAIDLSGIFLTSGSVAVIEEYGDGRRDEITTRGRGELMGLPVVVLINEGSASASEILAGALRDNRGVVLVGERSFGKGSVQELEMLKGKASVRITVAKWLTPSGETIDEEGIAPDKEVVITKEDINEDRDPQLDSAREEITKQLQE